MHHAAPLTSCALPSTHTQAGLEPTRQVKALATQAGFSNAHDYLIHLVTGEGPTGLLVSAASAACM